MSEQDKFDGVAASDVLVMPSYYESLSIVALEAWAVGTPVLANARCDVLKGQCLRSNAGLFYENADEFVEALSWFTRRPDEAQGARRQRPRVLPAPLRVARRREAVPGPAGPADARAPHRGRAAGGAASGLAGAPEADTPAGRAGARAAAARAVTTIMKIAFIVPRYGTEILGGPEYHCRLIAERLAERHQVEVLTTCARDHGTWQNEYPEGADRIRGVTVRRFPNARTRDIEAFTRYTEWICSNSHTAADEMEWLRQQGPWCPSLVEYLQAHHAVYDALVFFTYRYAPTVLGLRVAPARSILVPTAHDEPAIRLEIFKEVFSLPAGVGVQHGVRAALPDRGRSRFRPWPRRRLAAAWTCRSTMPTRATRPAPADATEARRRAAGLGRRPRPGRFRSHLTSRGAMFRRRHRLHGPFALYGGRIEVGKGCEELVEYFGTYSSEGGDASLVLMGVKLMPLPEEPFITFAGLLSDSERSQALEAATVVVVPSPYESAVAAGPRGVLGRHARCWPTRGARCWWTTAWPATPASSTRTATSSWSASTRSSATSGCGPPSAATGATTSGRTTAGTWCWGSTSG